VKRILTMTAILLVLLVSGACGFADTQINEIGLMYEGGITQNKDYKGILRPGATMESIGYGTTVYRYRIDQRSFIADDEGGDTGPVAVVSGDQRMLVEYQLYFTLNQEEETLKAFHENLGVKTEAWKTDGWQQLLNEYFKPQIERALEAAALQFDWSDLRASEETRRQFNTVTAQLVKQNLREVIGGEYFCGPGYQEPGDECGDFTFTVGKPELVNADLISAIEAEQVAVRRTAAQAQENERIRMELEAERERIAAYGPDMAGLLRLAESGKVPQIIVGPGGVSVAAPPAGG
jgi:hypothetical protein